MSNILWLGKPRIWPKVAILCQTPSTKMDGPFPLKKCHFILDMNFLVNEMDRFTKNFTWSTLCFLSIKWSKDVIFSRMDRLLCVFQNNRCFETLCRIDGRIQPRNSPFLYRSIYIYQLYLVQLTIWRGVIYLSFEKSAIPYENLESKSDEFYKHICSNSANHWRLHKMKDGSHLPQQYLIGRSYSPSWVHCSPSCCMPIGPT